MSRPTDPCPYCGKQTDKRCITTMVGGTFRRVHRECKRKAIARAAKKKS